MSLLDSQISRPNTNRGSCSCRIKMVEFRGVCPSDAVAVLQIKGMALKFSGAYRQCKPCTGSPSYKKGDRRFPDFDTVSEGVPYPFAGGGSSSSTPAWDFTGPGRHPTSRMDSRIPMGFGGDRTPGRASISAQSCDVVLEEEESKEWMAQVEPGVHITFESLPNGGNDLKRIRFRY